MSATVESYELDYRQTPPAVVRRTVPDGGDRTALWLHHLPGPPSGPHPHRSSREFQLTADNGASVARVVTEQPLGSRLTGRPGVYRVEDSYGAPLARITVLRRRVGRLRWKVEPVNGPVLQGYKGRVAWWAVW
ncbi:hypothetical protein [Streptomyces sp. NPDC014006]|uniref:hypothetical protein n=1 Tax=Streptomyces sp. NPDC014006 TaxID=3364870 RepID=UPI0036FE43A7